MVELNFLIQLVDKGLLFFPSIKEGMVYEKSLLKLFTKTLWNKWSRDQLIEITAIHLFCESPPHRNFYQVTDSLWFFFSMILALYTKIRI